MEKFWTGADSLVAAADFDDSAQFVTLEHCSMGQRNYGVHSGGESLAQFRTIAGATHEVRGQTVLLPSVGVPNGSLVVEVLTPIHQNPTPPHYSLVIEVIRRKR